MVASAEERVGDRDASAMFAGCRNDSYTIAGLVDKSPALDNGIRQRSTSRAVAVRFGGCASSFSAEGVRLSGDQGIGFKMFEKAPYELPNAKALIQAQVDGIKAQERVFGPIFIVRIVASVVDFIAQRVGERPPEEIKTLDQMAQYLLSKVEKYPTPYCAVMYSQHKVECDLQGKTGALSRVGDIGWQRNFAKTQAVGGKAVDFDRIVSDLRKASVMMKMSPSEFGYRKNEYGGVDFIIPRCFYLDGCRQAFEQGLLARPDGRTHCDLGSSLCQFFKVATSSEYDYELMEAYKPRCIVRYFTV